MSDTAIKVEDLGKLYRLGEIGTGTLSHDLNRAWAQLRGKEDPFAKIGEANDRTSKGNSNYVWSLKDINFEVKQGEVLGIIGRNGAGKSTLLKVLSKVTAPTTGRIKIKGRIASLLEVGTGFHPELTGRENVFLNGAILGMTKAEIRGKFDEIVDFSGVERYIDTPVKRYSSGMYVRLAFAVAAFLEPEILIVDEVLAVGDAEFQKKCLGRMKDVSINDGRTVLFVSHNMEAVQNLCTQALLMQQGSIIYNGDIQSTINTYVSKMLTQETDRVWEEHEAPGNDNAKLMKAKVSNLETGSTIDFNTRSGFQLDLEINNLLKEEQQLDVTYHLVDERGILVVVSSTVNFEPVYFRNGILSVKTIFPGNIINEGIYTFSRILLVKNRGQILVEWNDILSFEVLPVSQGTVGWQGQKEGVVKINNLPWEVSLKHEDKRN
jgi:lipopolysaccharide transport system ATP-binding protein